MPASKNVQSKLNQSVKIPNDSKSVRVTKKFKEEKGKKQKKVSTFISEIQSNDVTKRLFEDWGDIEEAFRNLVKIAVPWVSHKPEIIASQFLAFQERHKFTSVTTKKVYPNLQS